MAHRRLRLYERSDLYPQSISYYHALFHTSPDDQPYVANFWEVGAYKDGYFWWARDVDELEKAFRRWMEEWLSSPAARQKHYAMHRLAREQLLGTFVLYQDSNVARLPNEELLTIYRDLVAQASEFILFSEYTVDLFDDLFQVIFNEYLEEHAAEEISPEDRTEFMRPATLSASAEYHKALLHLSLQQRVNDEVIEQSTEEYSWIRMGWDGSNQLTVADVRNELEEIRKLRAVDRSAELNKLETYTARIWDRRDELVVEYGLEMDRMSDYFDLLDTFNVLHDNRKELQMRCNQIIYRILRELPNRFDTTYDDILLYFPEEIETLLQAGELLDREELTRRKSGMTQVIERGNVTTYYGEEAAQKLEELVLSVMRDAEGTVADGMPACTGAIDGIAFVTKSAKEANSSLQEGEILVTTMTTVEFLPAMKRAGGIVTDDGGMTCHAAVVSRELGTPCVVGTKNATQLFQSGDMVHLDATNGSISKQAPEP